MQTLKKELQERGFIYQFSDEKVFEKLEKWNMAFYCGFDPTSDSLHLGNFIGFMCAVHLMLKGNTYFALVGGATGMIGDPGGKESERTFLSEENLKKNEKAIGEQFKNILVWLERSTWKKLPFKLVNNLDFYTGLSYLDFLREVGKYHTVNQMMAKDTVKKRIEDPSKSISYTEFSYMLLQGYDFYKLFSENNVQVEIGGQDQWGNLMTGIELVRKKTEAEVYAFTWPLMLDASGKKFWKSEGNALFLDKNKTSAYTIYQYFLNTADEDIEKFLKILTLLDLEKIENIIKTHKACPEDRYGQNMLAYKVVEIIHWEKSAIFSFHLSSVIFWWWNSFVQKYSNSFKDFNLSQIEKNNPQSVIELLSNSDDEAIFETYNEIWWVEYKEQNLFELFVSSGLEQSNSTARQTFQEGVMYINEKKIEDAKYDFSADFVNGKFLILRKGKKSPKYKIVIKK